MKFSLLFISNLLFILLPISIVFSSFVMDLSIVFIDIVFLFYIFKNSEVKKYLYNKIFIFGILLCSYLIFSSLLSEYKYLSLSSSLFYIRFFVFIFAGYYLIIKNPNIVKYFFYSFLFIIVILFIDSNYQYFYEINLFGYEKINNRVTSFFKNEAILGSYISRNLLLIIMIFFILNINNKVNSIYPIFFIVFLLWPIILSGGRASLIYYITILTMLIFFISYFRVKLFIICSLSFVILSIIVFNSQILKKD